MSLAKYSLDNTKIIYFFLAVLLIGGITSFGKLGKKEDAAHYLKCAYNYRNVYNDKTAFFHPKDKNGKWIEPFDYRFAGGMGAREYYGENNGWVYRWDVPHNVADLIDLMGGSEQFIANLDQTFSESLGRSKYAFMRNYRIIQVMSASSQWRMSQVCMSLFV